MRQPSTAWRRTHDADALLVLLLAILAHPVFDLLAARTDVVDRFVDLGRGRLLFSRRVPHLIGLVLVDLRAILRPPLALVISHVGPSGLKMGPAARGEVNGQRSPGHVARGGIHRGSNADSTNDDDPPDGRGPGDLGEATDADGA